MIACTPHGMGPAILWLVLRGTQSTLNPYKIPGLALHRTLHADRCKACACDCPACAHALRVVYSKPCGPRGAGSALEVRTWWLQPDRWRSCSLASALRHPGDSYTRMIGGASCS